MNNHLGVEVSLFVNLEVVNFQLEVHTRHIRILCLFPKFGEGSLLSKRSPVRRDGERSRKLIMLQHLNGFDMEPRIKLAPEAED